MPPDFQWRGLRVPARYKTAIAIIFILLLVGSGCTSRAQNEDETSKNSVMIGNSPGSPEFGGGSNATDSAESKGALPDPSQFPVPVIGKAIRLDKPVEQPQPGYLIIPDDKPADSFLIGFPGDDEVKAFIMAGTSLSDNGLAHVPKFLALHTLDASGTRVTDSGLRHLQRAQTLSTLTLRNTRITDAGLLFLKQIKTLKSLDLTGTQVSDQGVAGLKQALPGLQVQR